LYRINIHDLLHILSRNTRLPVNNRNPSAGLIGGAVYRDHIPCFCRGAPMCAHCIVIILLYRIASSIVCYRADTRVCPYDCDKQRLFFSFNGGRRDILKMFSSLLRLSVFSIDLMMLSVFTPLCLITLHNRNQRRQSHPINNFICNKQV
jgi:hypothetical protein